MAARRLFSVLIISSMAIFPAAFAQESAIPVPEVQNSKYKFEGTINADAVLVRAGPSDNYYPVVRLDKGATITVVGITFDWLKIVPPDGSYSYIAKQFVNKTSDTAGTVTNSAVNVRAGSSISPMKTAVQTKLNAGDTVQILGEQDEYYKIKPPADAFLYVNKQFVTPGRNLGENPAVTASTMPTEASTPSPTTQEASTATPPPTTQFVVQNTTAEQKFDDLEKRLHDTLKDSLAKQPVADLLAGYQSVAADPQLPATLQRLAQSRIAYLKDRLHAQQDYQQAQKTEEQFQTQQQAMQAKQQQLQQKLAQERISIFAAVGTLRTSSVQEGGASLYRLADPNTGRTLVYVRPSDTSLPQLLGKLIGVHGTISDDPTLGLKIVSPTGVEVLTPEDLPKVSADIMPSSLSASTQP